MLAGDTLTGRFVPQRWRERLSVPLCLLLAAPYLIFALHPALPLVVAAVAQYTSPSTAMAVMAATSVAVTLALAPGLRHLSSRGSGGGVTYRVCRPDSLAQAGPICPRV